jgi:HlyD family secretion protein
MRLAASLAAALHWALPRDDRGSARVLRGILLLVTASGLIACAPQAPTAAAQSRQVAALPSRSTLPSTPTGVTTSGTVRLKSGASVRVGSQVSGIVRRLNVTVGSRIVRGEVIAEIDPKPLQARVDQEEALVAIAQLALGKAQRDVTRVRGLGASGVLPAQQVEDLDWQVKGAQAQLQKALTDLSAAKTELAYTAIRAPISGTVAGVSTQEGETVAAAFAAPTFVTIVDTESLELVAMVDETDIAAVRAGDRVSFGVEAYPGRAFQAVVKRIDPTPLVISGVVNYPVVADISTDKLLLRPDMTATISIATQEAKDRVRPTGLSAPSHRTGAANAGEHL